MHDFNSDASDYVSLLLQSDDNVRLVKKIMRLYDRNDSMAEYELRNMTETIIRRNRLQKEVVHAFLDTVDWESVARQLNGECAILSGMDGF